MSANPSDDARESRRFETTHWSLVASSLDEASGEAQGREALGRLCRTYWRPVFAFVCRRGHSVPDAQDLTQDFFMRVLQEDFLRQADEKRGRFRSFLLTSLKNFLHDAHDKKHSRKRGRDHEVISWDEWMAEAPSHFAALPSAVESWSAEKIFDVRWAATVAERALRRLQEECASRGRGRLFETLSRALMAERDEISYEIFTRELGVGLPEIRGALHRLRQRFRLLLREEVAATVLDPAEVDEELRYLCAALAAGNALPNEQRT